MKHSRLKSVRMSVDFIGEMVKIGEKTIRVEKGLPEDATVESVDYDYKTKTFHVYLSSDSFPEVPEGQIIPWYDDEIIITDNIK